MNNLLAQLASETFYARPNDLRSFFTSLMNFDHEKAISSGYERESIASYGIEDVTIKIEGLMLRSRSWITDLGFAVSTEEVIDEINKALAEERKVKLYMNTGGGLVSGTSNLADLIYENRDKIEAYGTGMVASAGMWVYSATGKRYAEATTSLGSIGVVTSVFDDEAYWKNYGIVWKEVVSEHAKNKRPDVKTDSGINEVKRHLTSLETIFIDTVSRNLGMSNADVVSKFHEGGLINGSQALEIGAINGLTTYNMVATMPSKRNADEKIAKNSNDGDNIMDITQEDFDAIQSQLATATASIKALEGDNASISAKLSEKEAELGEANGKISALEAKVNAVPEIVAMGFEHSVSKDTVIAMIGAGTKESAALVLLDSKKTTGATVGNTDIDEGANASEKEEEAETEMAIALAKKMSVGLKK